MQETNQLTNKMDGKETHKHPLENKHGKILIPKPQRPNAIPL